MPAWHSVQSGAAFPPVLYEPALQGWHSDALAARGLGLWVPGGQGVDSPESAGQKHPGAQGTGGGEDAVVGEVVVVVGGVPASEH